MAVASTSSTGGSSGIQVNQSSPLLEGTSRSRATQDAGRIRSRTAVSTVCFVPFPGVWFKRRCPSGGGGLLLVKAAGAGCPS